MIRKFPLPLLLLWTTLLASTAGSAAILNGGLEAGTFEGWDAMGDVTLQHSDSGVTPTEGIHQAMITTLCDSHSPVNGGDCQTTGRERPYASNALLFETWCDEGYEACTHRPGSPAGWAIFDFMGITADDFAAIPGYRESPVNGEGSMLQYSFFGHVGDRVSVDVNYVTLDLDFGLVTLLGTGDGATTRVFERIYPGDHDSGLALCERVAQDPDGNGDICGFLTGPAAETGYQTLSFDLTEAGTYALGFTVFEIEEGTVPTAMFIDNLRVTAVPLPASIGLLATALGGLLGYRLRGGARAFLRRC